MNQIIYCETLGNFIDSCLVNKNIGDVIKTSMKKVGYNAEDNWVASWQNSLPEVAKALEDTDIDKTIDVAVEYVLKHSKERLDFLIYGLDDFDRKNMVIVELKQWSYVESSDSLYMVNTLVAKNCYKDHFHPSYQAYNYAGQLKAFNEYVQKEKVEIESCSYCHNLDSGYSKMMKDEDQFPFIPISPVYLNGDKDKLGDFIKKYVSKKCHEMLYEITNAKTVPSDHFAKMIRDALNGNQMYSLDDKQQIALTTIVDSVRRSDHYDQKKTIIIKGGAGTGKSIIAINAMGILNSAEKKKDRINTFYVTVNSAPRKTLFKSLVKNVNYSADDLHILFKYPTSFKNTPRNDVRCIIVDEAHRLFKFKGGVGLKKGANMLKDIINGSKITVFFIDDNQAVTKDDYVTIDRIKEIAEECRSEVVCGTELELTAQYRVQGGADYIGMVKYFLGINKNKNIFSRNNSYDFRVFDDPNEMFDLIKEKDLESQKKQSLEAGKIDFIENEFNGHCRVVAGYTYEWVSNHEKRDGVYDVIIPEKQFAKKWNLQYGSGVSAYSWIDDNSSIDEIGCIHTCQGLDLDYCGVIIGKDIVYRDGRICFDKSQHAKTDRSGIRTAPDDIAETLIKNTYYVLLTRGILGTYVYCEDEALNNYLKSLIS